MRNLAFLLLLVWLPLQGVAATVMPFCDHAPEAAAGAEDGHAGHLGHQPAEGDPDSAGAPAACDDCGTCQLACSPAVPSRSAPTAGGWSSGFAAFECGTPPRFIPDQPQRPPLAPV